MTLNISIPHWFSLNPKTWEVRRVHIPHFHPTLVLAQPQNLGSTSCAYPTFPSHIGSRSTVLHPQKRFKAAHFHPTLVLAQLFISFKHQVHILLISIPHWFSLNQEAVANNPSLAKFPSHIGSRSTDKLRFQRSMESDFHPTLVLAQPSGRGSRLCPMDFHPTLVLAQRSIAPKAARGIQDFHPTLVLAQPCTNRMTAGILLFPSHIGSRST